MEQDEVLDQAAWHRTPQAQLTVGLRMELDNLGVAVVDFNKLLHCVGGGNRVRFTG